MSEYGGGHGGEACGFSHPDQSANWSMAFQSGETSKIDMASLKKTADPRMVIGGALVFFVGLISLPYIMDAIEDEQVAGKPEVEQTTSVAPVVAEAAPAQLPSETTTPESGQASDGQIFANGKQMFDSGKAQVLNEALNVSGLLFGGKGAKNPAHDGPDLQFNAAMGKSEPSAESAESEKASGQSSAAGAFFSAVDEGHLDASGDAGKTNANAYTNDAINNMVAASGIAPGQHQNRFVGTESPRRALAAMPAAEPQPGSPIVMAPPPMYGGAVQSSTQPYLIYVPGANAAAAPAAVATSHAVPAQAIAMAPGVQMPAVAQAGHPATPFEHRSAFNPQTSAITAPLGMRHHAGMMPMIPAAGQSGDYSGAGGRMRVFVNR